MINKIIGIGSGVIGGIINYQHLLQIQVPYVLPFWIILLRASITAVVCGFCGLLGKEIFVLLSPIFKKKTS